jgi:hypothetical protein
MVGDCCEIVGLACSGVNLMTCRHWNRLEKSRESVALLTLADLTGIISEASPKSSLRIYCTEIFSQDRITWPILNNQTLM